MAGREAATAHESSRLRLRNHASCSTNGINGLGLQGNPQFVWYLIQLQ
jgi:hypothetical protein